MLSAPWQFEVTVDLETCVGCSIWTGFIIMWFVWAIMLKRWRATTAQQVMRTSVDMSAAQQRQQQLQYQQDEQLPREQFFKGHVKTEKRFQEAASKLYDVQLSQRCNQLKGMFLAPFLCGHYLNVRVGKFTVLQSGMWLVPVMLAVELLVVITMPLHGEVHGSSILPKEIRNTLLLCFPLVVLVALFARLTAILGHDGEYVAIDNFTEHRSIKKCSISNIIRFASICYIFIECGSLVTQLSGSRPAHGHEDSSYEKAKSSFKTMFNHLGLVSLNFGLITQTTSTLLMFVLSMIVVTVWVYMFNPLIGETMKLAAMESNCECLGRPEYICIRMHIYERLKQSKLYAKVFLLLSETLFIPTVTNLMKPLPCSFSAEGTSVRFLPDLECFAWPHSCLATLGVIALFLYVPSIIAGASFMLADSDGKFVDKSLDILLESRFIVVQTLAKVTLSITSVFIGPLSPAWACALEFTANIFMAHVIFTVKPCSIIWVNYLYGTAFAVSANLGLMTLWDETTDVVWWPVVGFIVVASLAVVAFMLCVHSLHAVGYRPDIYLSPNYGVKATHASDGKAFNDTSLCRGTTHRLRQITFWNGRGGSSYDANITGIQSVYEVDGSIIFGPPHLVPGATETDEKQTIFFERDERLESIHVEWWDAYCLVHLKTNKRNYYPASNSANRGILEPDQHGLFGGTYMVDEGEVVVGLHGCMGGGLLSMGFVLQRASTTQGYASGELSRRAPKVAWV